MKHSYLKKKKKVKSLKNGRYYWITELDYANAKSIAEDF